ncbi:MAG: ATP-binding cassette domain-containing protein [Lachnospiraceae bacterium]|nr:ATP-binding cassette domain-containing protein [Lachnospiraceae bacterium]
MEYLNLEHITKTYPNGKTALKDISLTLTPGIYGLLGPNGAGKSTMMQIMTQNLAATAGTIYYQDQPIETLGRNYRRQIGFMPQQQNLLDGFTDRRFLWYMAALKGMSRANAKTQIEQMLQVVNLTEAADHRIGGYSGGMKQRLLLAQALLNDPKILVLDEPTAGLDPRERQICAGDLAGVEKRVCVSNVTLTGEEYRVRIVTERRHRDWQRAEPTLEDVYLYYFTVEGSGR